MERRNFLSSMALSATACALPSLASANPLPAGPVRIVVGFPAGGGTDVLARLVGNKLNAMWNLPVIIENKVGAAGLIAAANVAKAEGDGTTLLMAHINSHGIAPGLQPKLQYSAENDFTPIALVGQTPQVLVTNMTHPVTTLAALITHCKKNAGKVAFGSAGLGSAQHLALALLEQTSGISALHVPYKGSAPLMTDLIGGQVEFAFEGMTTAAPFIKSGKLRGLAQTGAKRAKAFSDLPTMSESGAPGFTAGIWFGMVGPARMPEAMVARMNADIDKILAMPDVVARLDEFGAEDGGGSAGRFGQFMRDERSKWSQLIKARGITLES